MSHHALYHLLARAALCLGVLLSAGRLSAERAFDVTLVNSSPVAVSYRIYHVEEIGVYGSYSTHSLAANTTAHFTGTVDAGGGEEPASIYEIRRDFGGFEVVGNSYIKTTEYEENYMTVQVVAEPPFGSGTLLWTVVLNGHDATPDGAKTLWALNDETLTADVFREGVDKIVYAQGQVSAGGGGGGDTTYTETINHEAVIQYELKPTTGEMATHGGEAADELVALMPEAPTETGYTVDAGSSPSLSIAMPAAFGGHTFDFNPFREDRLGPIVAWFRYALEWLVLILLGIWVSEKNKQFFIAVSAAQQAKGNTVAGTGGQLTALAAAGIMSALVVVFATALLAWSFGGLDLPALIGKITVNPIAGIASGSLWMLQQVFPIGTIVLCLVARFTYNLYATPLYAVCITLIRFVVP